MSPCWSWPVRECVHAGAQQAEAEADAQVKRAEGEKLARIA